jgi:O-antigen/teichoic acid export membrane protein
MNAAPIEHRAAKVSLVNGFSTLLAICFQLVSVPVCLHYWGKESYGSWLALYSAFMLLRSIDGGYTVFVGNKLNYLYHLDTSALRVHLASAVAGIVVISALQMALTLGTLAFEPLSGLLGMTGDRAHSLSERLGLLTLMTTWVLSGSYLGIVHRLLIPSGLMYQAGWWAMEFQLAQFCAIMLAAVWRLGMLQTSLLFAATQLFSYAASAIYVRYKLPGFSPWLHGARTRVGLRDLGESVFLTTSNLVQQGAFNGSVVLVSTLAGPAAVPIFTTVRTLTNLWTSVTTVLSTPLLPDVVRLHAKGEFGKLIAINAAFWVLVGTVVNLGALLSYPLIPYLYAQWTRHGVALDQPLLCLLLASVVMANAGALMTLHLNGINSLRIVLGASLARASFSLGVGGLAYGRHGLASFGLGILLGEIVATLLTAGYFLKHEIIARGSSISPADFLPVSLSTGSVIVFFAGAALDWWSVGLIWALALLAVLVATVWGWQGLQPDLRARLIGMSTSALRRKGSAS